MIFVYLIIGMLALYVLYELQKFWRLPSYHKVYNMWQEDPTKISRANLTIIIMCMIAYILGIISATMIS
jgi:hypothetical protein